MEHEGSLPCSQEHTTGAYPHPDQSSSYHPILSKIHFNIVYPPTSCHSSGLFPSGFSTNILYAFLFSPIRDTWPSHLILLGLLSFQLYLAKSTSSEAPHYAVCLDILRAT
jgi:hypothetical protein